MFLLQPQSHGVVSSLSHAQVVIKMAWYDDVGFQQRTLIERLVAEKRLKNMYGVNAVDEGTASRWIHHFESQTARRSVEWHRPASQNRTFRATSFTLLLGHRRGDFGRYYAMCSNR